tara:strand:- start:1086 stop:1649 length:564 start_codon:yes stop_codon:yes gene_type:complete
MGDSYVGKSNIVSQLCNNRYSGSSMSTLGIDFYMKTFNICDIALKFHIWDTSGQPQYKSIVEAYYKTVDIVIICYDISNKDSFHNVRNWYDQIKGFNLDKSLIYIVGNKIDLEYSEVSIYELRDLAEELGVNYKQLSAKDNINILELFNEICIKFLTSEPRKRKDSSIVLKQEPPIEYKNKLCNICS